MRILLIGHSHIYALKSAYKSSVWDFKGELEFLPLLIEPYKPVVTMKGASFELNSFVEDKLKSIDKQDIIVSCVGGNHHNQMCLLNHNEPFDFVFDCIEGGDLLQERRILSFQLAKAALAAQLRVVLFTIEQLVRYSELPVIHIESPPPIGDEQHILSYPGAFQEGIKKYGISPRELRYKFWRLHSQILKEHCDNHRIVFCPAPSFTMDESGFLLKEFLGQDPTHGNTLYGIEQLTMLKELIDKQYN